MSLLPRGIFWFSVYLLLVIAPAVVAVWLDPFSAPRPALVEISVALALFAAPVILVQFALVSRFRASSRPFGTDALIQFHRYMGFVALAFVAAHPLLLNLARRPLSSWSPFSTNPVAGSGAIALWVLVALVATTVLRRTLRLSYEGWQAIHLGAAVVVVALVAAHVFAVGGYSRSPLSRGLLAAYVAAFGALLVGYTVVRPLRLRSRPWEITRNGDLGAGTRLLVMRPTGHSGFPFDPGQFAWLITGASPFSRQQHPLSIASSAERPSDGAIEFAIKGVGDWSRDAVSALAPGARVWVDGPFGAFTTERKAAQGFVLIAGGIGFAPVRSMLLTMRDRQDRRHVILVYAVRDPSRAIFDEEISALRASLNLDVVIVLEDAPDDFRGERGYLTRELLARHLPPHFRRYHYFVCGPPPMMNAVESTLLAMGVAPGAIDSERFQVV